jgi:hypothetical protein
MSFSNFRVIDLLPSQKFSLTGWLQTAMLSRLRIVRMGRPMGYAETHDEIYASEHKCDQLEVGDVITTTD